MDAADRASDLTCYLFDLAGAPAGERTDVVAVLAAALRRPGLTAVVNTHEMAALLRRKLSVVLGDIFDSQVRRLTSPAQHAGVVNDKPSPPRTLIVVDQAPKFARRQ